MQDPGRRHHSVAEPPNDPWSHNRVALEDHSWFNHTNNAESAPRYTESSQNEREDSHEHGANDDLPPTYVGSDLPEYDVDDPDAPPIHTFHLQQVSRSLQLFVPEIPESDYTYQLAIRTSPKLFTKKADITILRSASFERTPAPSNDTEESTPPTTTTSSRTILPRRRNSAASVQTLPATPSGPGPTTPIAHVNFDDSAQLPWMPRATLTLLPASGTSSATLQTVNLSCHNFRIWRFAFPATLIAAADEEPPKFMWNVPDYGPIYRLYSSAHRRPIAQFTHSALGTRARNGGEVGVLRVWREYTVPEGPDVGSIIGSLGVAMAQVRRMGRHTLGARGGGMEGRLIDSGVYRSLSMSAGGMYSLPN